MINHGLGFFKRFFVTPILLSSQEVLLEVADCPLDRLGIILFQVMVRRRRDATALVLILRSIGNHETAISMSDRVGWVPGGAVGPVLLSTGRGPDLQVRR